MKPKFVAKLDKNFQPMALLCRYFKEQTKDDGQDIIIAIERNKGYITTYKTRVFKDNCGHDEENFRFIERLTKSLLWVAGGYKIIIAGSEVLGEKIKAAYTNGGLRDFDVKFMERVYEQPFTVEICSLENAPKDKSSAAPIGRHLDGCRIGFDAGGSDRKISAVIDGETVYSEEVVWFPKTNSDPDYHYNGILNAMKTAASHMPKVDAIGVSSAGVYIDNRIMVASLFIKVSDDDFDKKVKNIYLDVAKEIGENIPIEVANDGDVTALAGAMDLNDNSVLGITIGTSEAGGYVDPDGNITGWLNELAFVPVDFNEDAKVDEWKNYYKSSNQNCLFIDSITGAGINEIMPTIREILKEKIARYEEKGMSGRSIKAMIVGIPNSGKSSLINKLAGSKKVKVEDRPGVTLTKQWVPTSIGLDLMDMPGVLWPKFDDEKIGENLALTGAIMTMPGLGKAPAAYSIDIDSKGNITGLF